MKKKISGLDENTYTIQSLDPFNDLYDNWGKGAFQRFTGLKVINPQLKTLLAIGGWNEGATKYSQMASTTQRRALFIQSALDMVRAHGFDGLDLDWEYPGKNHLHLMYRLASETFQTTLVGISVLRGPCCFSKFEFSTLVPIKSL